MVRKVEISHKTIFFAILVIAAIALLYKIADIILQFSIAILITAFLDPYVTKLSKYRVPRGVSILLAYIILISILSFSIYAIIPPLVDQTTSFINNLPGFLGSAGISSIASEKIVNQLVVQLGALPAEIAKLTVSVFSNILSLVTVLVFSFYLLVERDRLNDRLGMFFGEKNKERVVRLVDILEMKLGGWARGQLALMFIIGLGSYIGLQILGIPYALPLAIITGIMEIIPFIGPTLSAVPAVIIGLGISPLMGLAVVAVYVLIQQLENSVFVPKVMQKSANVNPIITLLSLAIGFRLAGIVGLLVSVPVFITVRVFVNEFVFNRQQ